MGFHDVAFLLTRVCISTIFLKNNGQCESLRTIVSKLVGWLECRFSIQR